MYLKLEKFVGQDKIKELSIKLLNAKTDTIAYNIIKDITSIGELRKIKIFVKCQKRDIGNNFSALAIYISTIAILLPAIERLFDTPYVYIIFSIALASGLCMAIFRDGVPFINKNNEHNAKVEYIAWLIDEEITRRNPS
ncbi:hypothetical protein [Alkalihalobacterium alkalinitrilicum]|uniref:hypothetical protein n=1 Tax=Alkalihalobacterium alkalinitrilicum TaxID=427920 RepID=UPI0009955A92|nr:hypothetical protein [Alkalihalobacterium alkalinitrilicum]